MKFIEERNSCLDFEEHLDILEGMNVLIYISTWVDSLPSNVGRFQAYVFTPSVLLSFT